MASQNIFMNVYVKYREKSTHIGNKSVLIAIALLHSTVSSSQLKTHVNVSDRMSSLHMSACAPVCKLFTFLYFSRMSLGQFQPNLAQSIEFQFVSLKDHVFSKGR